MKVWIGFGSEHSQNLVMIGSFKTAKDALRAQELIGRLITQVNADVEAERIQLGGGTERFGDEMQAILREAEVYSIAPGELEQFAYESRVEVEKERLVMTTDEIDVSAFLKVLISLGARVEVYSAHAYPGTGYGRGA